MFENFKKAVSDALFNDDQIEAFFWLIATQEPDKTVAEGIELLSDHRPELARKIAHDILKAATETNAA